MVQAYPPAKLDAIRANVFAEARDAIGDWSRFPWHPYADSRRSSQALAVDVFGTIAARSPKDRDRILAALARKVRLPSAGPWRIEFEWSDPSNGLGEIATTKVDAVAFGAEAIILFECKFTEAGGTCSQTVADKRGHIACNGAYRQRPDIGDDHCCALSRKGIRYWDFVSEAFGIDTAADFETCPFAFDDYQWMRNVVLAMSVRRSLGIDCRVIAAYADAPHLRTAIKARTGRIGLPTLRAEDAVLPLSYQEIVACASAEAPSEC